MAENDKKFIIEIFRKKDAEELTKALSDAEGKLHIGSAAALAAAEACAMALRAAAADADRLEAERRDYLLRNLETQRAYMVYLIDEDVKGRNILKRARKEADEQKIEAALHPACAISDEIISSVRNLLELFDELSAVCTAEGAAFLGSAAELAMAALRCARLYVLATSGMSGDETFRFVTRRENELTLEGCAPVVERILARVEAALR